MNLQTFVKALENILPPSTAMKGDRIGLQLQSGRSEISSVFVTMELTENVAREAIENNADCIVAFHPLIFAPMTEITDAERVGRICTMLISHKIALVIAHTNFDAFPQGTSSILAQKLGITVECALQPDARHEGFGMGIVGSLNAPEPIEQFVARLSKTTSSPLRYTLGKSSEIQRVAIVGGSGTSFIDSALAASADAFITADIKYHDFHRVQGRMALIDPGHYEMEQFVPLGLAALVKEISDKYSNSKPLEISCSKTVPNPILYFPDTNHYKEKQQNALQI